MNAMRMVALVVLLATLAGCAGGPRFATRDVDTHLTPATVAAGSTDYTATRVVWGGVIVATHNLPDYTELEVLSYPLDDSQRPDTAGAAQGRFLARYPHYLETMDYAPGRRITISGTLEKVLPGKVGEAPYRFPLIKTDALYLWPRADAVPSSPQFHFGVGVVFGG